MDKQALFDQIKGGLIVSCQALEHVILVMMDGNGHSPIGSLGLLYFRCTRKNAEKIPTLEGEVLRTLLWRSPT